MSFTIRRFIVTAAADTTLYNMVDWQWEEVTSSVHKTSAQENVAAPEEIKVKLYTEQLSYLFPSLNITTLIKPLNTKRRLLYLKTQFVPRSKQFSSRL